MQTYLKTPSDEIIAISTVPTSRSEAVALITPHVSPPGIRGVFRIFAIEEFDVSPIESCEVEVFAVGLRHYGEGVWGLVEASVDAALASSDFSPTTDDVVLWLKALRDCWQVQPSDFACVLDAVDDFHVLQFFEGQRLLTSVTWNAPDVHTAYLMPKTLDTIQHLWGDGLLADVGLLFQALRDVNFFSLRK